MMSGAAVLLWAHSSYCSYITMGVASPRGVGGGAINDVSWQFIVPGVFVVDLHSVCRLISGRKPPLRPSSWTLLRTFFPQTFFHRLLHFYQLLLLDGTDIFHEWFTGAVEAQRGTPGDDRLFYLRCFLTRSMNFFVAADDRNRTVLGRPVVAKLFMTMIFPSHPIPGLWMKCQEGCARCSPHTSERARTSTAARFASRPIGECLRKLVEQLSRLSNTTTRTLQTSLYKRMITDVN